MSEESHYGDIFARHHMSLSSLVLKYIMRQRINYNYNLSPRQFYPRKISSQRKIESGTIFVSSTFRFIASSVREQTFEFSKCCSETLKKMPGEIREEPFAREKSGSIEIDCKRAGKSWLVALNSRIVNENAILDQRADGCGGYVAL